MDQWRKRIKIQRRGARIAYFQELIRQILLFSIKRNLIETKMLSTISPFQSLAKESSQEVLEEIFKNKQYNDSTIATTK